MGVFWRGLPTFLLDECRKALGPDAIAIETGTYLGDSASLLGAKFGQCITIELDEKLAERATNRFKNHPNIVVRQGTTRTVLPSVLPPSSRSALIWLDAHFSGGVTAGEEDKCPLLAEVEMLAVERTPQSTIILIDDAREMVGQGDWPFLGQVVGLLDRNGWAVAAIDDVLIATNHETLTRLLQGVKGKSRLFSLEKIAGKWQVVVFSIQIMKAIMSLLSQLNQMFQVSRIKRMLRSR